MADVCSQCKQLFDLNARRPKLLPCGDTVCLSCLTNVSVCPDCKDAFNAADDGPGTMPDNVYLHKKLVASAQAGPMTVVGSCKLHPGSLVVHHCRDHLLNFCADCLVNSEHRTHTIISTRDAATTEATLQATKAEAAQLVITLQGVEHTTEAETALVHARHAAVGAEIDAFVARLKNAADERGAVLRGILAGLSDDKIAQLTAQIQGLGRAKIALVDALAVFEGFLLQEDFVSCVDHGKVLTALLASVKAEQRVLVPVAAADVAYVSDVDAVAQHIAASGRVWASGTAADQTTLTGPGVALVNTAVTLTLTARDTAGAARTVGGDDVDVDVAVRHDHNAALKVALSVHDNKDGTYTLTFTPTHAGPHTTTVLYRGRPVRASPLTVPVHVFEFYNMDRSRMMTDEMLASLYGMFPTRAKGLRLLLDSNSLFTPAARDAAVRGCTATLIVVRANTGHVFGAAIFDSFEGGGAGGRYIPGHADNFLFKIGGEHAPMKLLKKDGADGLWIQDNYGLYLGHGDLVIFRNAFGGSCSPRSFTVVAPGYPAVDFADSPLAGAQAWVADRMEIFAIVA